MLRLGREREDGRHLRSGRHTDIGAGFAWLSCGLSAPALNAQKATGIIILAMKVFGKPGMTLQKQIFELSAISACQPIETKDYPTPATTAPPLADLTEAQANKHKHS